MLKTYRVKKSLVHISFMLPVIFLTLHPASCEAFVSTGLNETITWSIPGATNGWELSRFHSGNGTDGGSVQIHFVTDMPHPRQISISAAYDPVTNIVNLSLGGTTNFAPYSQGLRIEISSYNAQSYASSGWYEGTNWPDHPGTISLDFEEYFYRSVSSNRARIIMTGLWMNSPTNDFRAGIYKEIFIYLYTFDDIYGYEDISDAPWVKGYPPNTAFIPSVRKRPKGCGQCSPMGLPAFRVNTAAGNLIIEDTDYAYSGLGPDILLSRTYNGDPATRGMFGNGWDFEYERTLTYHRYGHNLQIGSGGHHYYSGAYDTNGTIVYFPPAGTRDSLSSWTDWSGGKIHYTYKEKSRDLTYLFERGIPVYPATGEGEVMPVTRILDANSNEVTLGYSGGLISYIQDSAGRETVFDYHPSGLCTNMTVPTGQSCQFSYDGSDNLIETVDLYGNTTVYGYNSDNLVTSMTTEGRTWLFRYNGRLISETVNPLSHTTQYSMVNAFLSNRCVQITDASGNDTLYYSLNGNTWKIRDPNANEIVTSYNSDGLAIAITNPLGHAVHMDYDADRNLIRREMPDGGVTTFGHNSDNKITAITNARGYVTQFTYDDFGNMIRMVSPLGKTAEFSFDANGLLAAATNSTGQSISYSYDSFGNVASVIDEAGYETRFFYDAYGINLIAQTNAHGVGAQFTYDENRRLTRVTHQDGTSIIFSNDCCTANSITDENGHTLRSERNQLLQRTAEYNAGGAAATYAYNGLGLITNITDRRGYDTRFSYEARGFLERIDYPDGGYTRFYNNENGELVSVFRSEQFIPALGWIYDSLTFYDYDENGRVKVFQHPGQAEVRTYWDTLNRITNQVNGRAQSIVYDYNNDNQLTAKHLPSETYSFAYDAGGRLTNASCPAVNIAYTREERGLIESIIYNNQLSVNYTYDPLGQNTMMLYPDGAAVTFQYNSRGFITNMQWAGQSTAYTHDGTGQVLSQSQANGIVSTYSYDPDNNITGIQHDSPSNTLIQLICQADAAGHTTNISKSSGLIPWQPPFNPTTETYMAIAQIQNKDGIEFSYDADGNLTNIADASGWVAEYNAENRLTSLARAGTNTAYTYDAFGRCAAITRGGITRKLYWDHRDRLLFEADTAGNVTATYIYRNIELVAMHRPECGWQFFHFDHNGNTIALTDEDGAVSAIYNHLPFGKTAGAYSRINNPFTFGGALGVLDEGGGLYYMRARFYDANLRRFLTIDPVGLQGGDNVYAFAGNNPISRQDPSGLMWRERYSESDNYKAAKDYRGITYRSPMKKYEDTCLIAMDKTLGSSPVTGKGYTYLKGLWLTGEGNYSDALWEVGKGVTGLPGVIMDFLELGAEGNRNRARETEEAMLAEMRRTEPVTAYSLDADVDFGGSSGVGDDIDFDALIEDIGGGSDEW